MTISKNQRVVMNLNQQSSHIHQAFSTSHPPPVCNTSSCFTASTTTLKKNMNKIISSSTTNNHSNHTSSSLSFTKPHTCNNSKLTHPNVQVNTQTFSSSISSSTNNTNNNTNTQQQQQHVTQSNHPHPQQQGFCLILDTQSTSIHSNNSLQMHFRCKKSYKDYTLDDISQYFHLPIKEVASSLNVSVTFLKKVCRRLNISRWPYRKVTSLHKKISDIKQTNITLSKNNTIINNNNTIDNINDNSTSVIITTGDDQNNKMIIVNEEISLSSFSSTTPHSNIITSSIESSTLQHAINKCNPCPIINTTNRVCDYHHDLAVGDSNENHLENHSTSTTCCSHNKENNMHPIPSMYSNDIKNPSSESSTTLYNTTPTFNTTTSSSSWNTSSTVNTTTTATTMNTIQYNSPQSNCQYNSFHSLPFTIIAPKRYTFDSYNCFNCNTFNTTEKECNETRRSSIDSIIERRSSIDQVELSSSNYNSSFEKNSVNTSYSDESKNVYRDLTTREVIYLPSFNDFCKQAGL
ncbi:predicted protein [Naegleria gruberi]|uniref:Predicted protein n=1 Tax=Naegleria gruberi TaxID=5762 RepID=D2V3F6_NAEGR|nr:uncharacterized protein NAEGRDRAFT_78403 [Naegleria gruberi]EFC48629.1 predicted protein [Naegleria gruberi]|eukprot:XP_002681373.1 predicted protein [Naegleria gruberi strain NEG-M]